MFTSRNIRLYALSIVSLASFASTTVSAASPVCRVVVSSTNTDTWSSSARKVGQVTKDLSFPLSMASVSNATRSAHCKDFLANDLDGLMAESCNILMPKYGGSDVDALPGMANLQVYYVNSSGTQSAIANKQMLCQAAMGITNFQKKSSCYLRTTFFNGTTYFPVWSMFPNSQIPECDYQVEGGP